MTNNPIKKSIYEFVKKDIHEFVQQDVSLILKEEKEAVYGHFMNLSKEGNVFYFQSEDDLTPQTYRLNELQGIEKNGSKYIFE